MAKDKNDGKKVNPEKESSSFTSSFNRIKDYIEEKSVLDNKKQELYYYQLIDKILTQDLHRKRHRFVVSSFSLILSICLALLLLSFIYDDGVLRVEKETIKHNLSSVIKNGGSLDLVKHVYDTRPKVKTPFYKKVDPDLYYYETASLAHILNDLSVDNLIASQTGIDSVYCSRLNYIIQENQYHNPFDNLEDAQTVFFENIRFKTGGDYTVIKDDVDQIAAELGHKNNLVTKYLQKSNTSLILSLIALFLTIVLSLIQIIQGMKTKDFLETVFESQTEEINSDKKDGSAKQEKSGNG